MTSTERRKRQKIHLLYFRLQKIPVIITLCQTTMT